MVSAPPLRSVSSGQVELPQEQSLVPVGMATILPEAARHVRHLESQLLAHVFRWGYDEIILPTFEYLDVLAPGLESKLIENCYKIVDRATGRILSLRPDVTAQIARTIAMGMMGTRLPLRLSYRAPVFRYEPEHAGRDREILQVGVELVGPDNATADCEIITMLIECLQSVGLREFKVSLGHVGFFKGLLIRAGLSPQGQKSAEQAAARKDLPWLEEILQEERVPHRFARSILRAPELCGCGDVLVKGRKLAGTEQPLLQALDRLTTVYRVLCSAGFQDRLVLDLGEFRGFDYYDGIVFDVFTEGIGAELGGGGRYDQLIGRFGRSIPSTGFALNVDRLFRGLNLLEAPTPKQSEVFVVAPPTSTGQLIAVAAELRRSGLRVVQHVLSGPVKAMIDTAIEMGNAAGSDAVVILGTEKMDRARALVFQSEHQARGRGTTGRLRIHKTSTSLSKLVEMLCQRSVAAMRLG